MIEAEQQALDYVRRYVRYGYYTPKEIERIVGRDVFKDAIPHRRLHDMVAAESARHRAEQASWPEVTDCDRLDTVFDTLTDAGILALQNAGCTLSEGLGDVVQEYHEAGGEQSGITGFCYFHRQDLEEVLESGKLYVAFGAFDGDSVAVGQRVADALRTAGFTVEWSGTAAKRILLKGIRWLR